MKRAGFVLNEFLMSLGIGALIALGFFQVMDMFSKDDIFSRSRLEFLSAGMLTELTLKQEYNCTDYLTGEALDTVSGVKLESASANQLLLQEGAQKGFRVDSISIKVGEVVGEAEKATLTIKGSPLSQTVKASLYTKNIQLLVSRAPSNNNNIGQCAIVGTPISSCMVYAGLACTPDLGTAGVSALFCGAFVGGQNLCLYPMDVAP